MDKSVWLQRNFVISTQTKDKARWINQRLNVVESAAYRMLISPHAVGYCRIVSESSLRKLQFRLFTLAGG